MIFEDFILKKTEKQLFKSALNNNQVVVSRMYLILVQASLKTFLQRE